MSKLITISDEVSERLDEMRDEFSDEGKKAPYNTIIIKLLKKDNRWNKSTV
jgi:predicted CopG family antitoxin